MADAETKLSTDVSAAGRGRLLTRSDLGEAATRAQAPTRRRISSSVRGRTTLSASLPSNFLAMKPAQRLARLTNLPTRSALTRATKSPRLRSRSSTPPDDLAA